MFGDAIYSPHLDLPDDLWLRNALLYWDKIMPIVPHEAVPDADHFSWRLAEKGLVEFRDPSSFHMRMVGTNYVQEFLQYLSLAQQRPVLQLDPGTEKVTPIHLSKLAYDRGFVIHLERLGLASRPSVEGDGWIDFVPWAGRAYMAYLALRMASSLGSEVATDDYVVAHHYRQMTEGRAHEATSCGLTIQVEAMLPQVTRELPIEEVADFRHRHQDEYARFKRVLNDLGRDLADYHGELRDDRIQNRLIGFKREIDAAMVALQRSQKRPWSELALAGMLLTFSLGSLAYSSWVDPQPVLQSLSGATVLVSGYNAIHSWTIRKREALEPSPFAYLYLTRSRLR